MVTFFIVIVVSQNLRPRSESNVSFTGAQSEGVGFRLFPSYIPLQATAT